MTFMRVSWTRSASSSWGARPLKGLLDEVDAIATTSSLLATAGRFERRGTSGFFQLFIDNDPGDPERYLVFFEQAGLGLPDESYYRDEKFAEIRTKYVEYLTKILGLAGLHSPDERRSASSLSRPISRRTTGTTCAPATAKRPTTSHRGKR